MDYTDICLKIINGTANEDEKKLFDEWISLSGESIIMYNEIKNIWDSSKVTLSDNFPPKEIEWEKIKERIEYEIYQSATNSAKTFMQPHIYKFKPAYGLLSVLLLILTLVVLNEPHEQLFIQEFMTVSTANKEKKELTLPDGSIIILNSGSSVSYSNIFSKTDRKVKLSGEAFFDVQKNSHPFIITAGNAEVEVIGTKFGVWTREERTRVVVEEGEVNLSNKFDDNQSIQLQRNQLGCLTLENGLTKSENIDSKKFFAWLENKLRFNNTSLKDISWEFKKYYGRDLIAADSSLNSLTLTGEFENENPEEAVMIICLALHLDYEKSGDGFILKKKHGD